MGAALIKTDDRFIDMRQGKIYVKRWMPSFSIGREPILLIHDSLGCVQLWRDFPERLCETTGRSVIAYDRLGFGLSDTRTGPLPMDFIKEESKTCIPAIHRDFGLDKFIVFGHSVGGGIAAVCAVEFRTQCIGVITESAQAFIEERTLTGVLKARESSSGDAHIERLKKYHAQKAEWVFHSWINTWLSPQFASWSLGPDIQGIVCPLLAIHGDRDAYGSLKQPETICALAGGLSKMVILPDCGHVPHRESPQKILEIISDFIRFDVAQDSRPAIDA